LHNKYDICIGASYIHDKKGQWRMIHVLNEFRRMFGFTPKCIMPGALRSASKTPLIIERHSEFEIEMPGMLERTELAKVLNQSSIGVFLGTSGQNDRGPLEAMQCGCEIVLGYPSYHSPVTYANSKITFVPEDIDDYKSIAIQLHDMIENYNPKSRYEILEWNKKNAHADYVTFPMMERMFDMIRENPIPDPKAMRREYGV
jgi:glycosyltransferase involved in cell wall biosynthesis